jgi:uncharacterized protein YbaP (TraB family)
MNRALLRILVLFVTALAWAVPVTAANFLWEIQSLTGRGYIYGTVHAGKQSWFPLPEAVEKAFSDSNVLVVEADITDPAAAKDDGSLRYAPPDSLKAHIASEDYERFRKLLTRYRVPEDQVAQGKPFMAASLLVFAEWIRQGYHPIYGIDGYLIQKAKAEAKPVIELEGVEMQMRLIGSLTEEESREIFSSTLVALENGLAAEQVNGVVKAWKEGKPDDLLEVARKYDTQVKGAEALEDKFIWSRHDEMLKKIDGYLRDSKQRHFIAVGALHLAGPRGLVEQLRKRGYIVRQI